ncbi:hypothetical protein MIR68_006500 [Amoeboaphelidium protococcarum]|nr:hypothetical protein MIR68_006500 [Amoeboaphelidium protococcarum]
MKAVIFSLCLMASCLSAGQIPLMRTSSGQDQQLTPEKLIDAYKYGDLVTSPSGNLAAYVVSHYDRQSGQSMSKVNIQFGTLQVSTDASLGVKDSSPVWLKENALSFIRSKDGKQQLMLTTLEHSGDNKLVAKAIADIKYPIDHLKYHVKGKFFSFSSYVYPDEPTLKGTADRDEAKKRDEKSTGQVFDNLYMRHWDKYEDGKVSHIFTVPFDLDNNDKEVDFDSAKNMMVHHPSLSTPVKPFPDAADYNFSDDGQYLVFNTFANNGESRQAWATHTNIFMLDTQAPQSLRKVNGDGEGARSRPKLVGDWVYFLEMERAGYEADKNVLYRVCVKESCSSNVESLTGHYDFSVKSYELANQGQMAFIITENRGRSVLLKLNLATGRLSKISNKQFQEYSVSDVKPAGAQSELSGQFYAIVSSYIHPTDVALVTEIADVGVSQMHLLTHDNDNLVKGIQYGVVENITFTGARNESVQGWFIHPSANAAKADGKLPPLVVLIHGGPQSAWLNQWSYRWNPQVFAAQGYAVLMINFHGSTGFGQNFTDSIRGNWGSYPNEDIVTGVKYAVSKYGGKVFNADNIYGLGASYGGFMINWLNGNNQDKMFKCFVNHDGVFDSKSMWFTTDELYFNEWEFLGTPWESPEVYSKWDPSRLVEKWETPTMFIHGALDYRVPLDQGIGAFTALQRRGVKSRFLLFPDENHWVLNNENSLKWHKEIFRWLSNDCPRQ